MELFFHCFKGRIAFLRGMHIEEKEVVVYSKLIPAWKKMIKERKVELELNLCPAPFIEFIDEPDPTNPQDGSIIALEHMGQYGYR